MPALLATPHPSTQRRERRRTLTRALVSTLLGVTLQGLLVLLFVGASSLGSRPRSARAASKAVSLRPISSARWASNRGATRPTVAERPAPLHPTGQVVDVAPGNDRVPEESKYLAESNNTVKRETRAREQTNTWSRATPTTQPDPMAQPSARGRPRETPQAASAPSQFLSELGRKQFSLLGGPTVAGVAGAEQVEPPAPVGTEGGTQAAAGGDATEGGGAPNDALSAPEGDGTFLNTREWRYAAFFNRVKQAVSARWDPRGRLRSRQRDLGLEERQTVLNITLRPDGSLADAWVQKSSGIDDLDQEAVRAFEKAQPFPNPPAALVEQGGIRFVFGFTVTNGELGGPLRYWQMPPR